MLVPLRVPCTPLYHRQSTPCCCPAIGALYAAIGNWRYSKLELSNQYKEKKAGFTRIERDLRHAISTAYGGSPEAKQVASLPYQFVAPFSLVLHHIKVCTIRCVHLFETRVPYHRVCTAKVTCVFSIGLSSHALHACSQPRHAARHSAASSQSCALCSA